MDNVIFSSEFDPGGFRKGALAIVESLNQVATKQKEVQEQFDITTSKLEAVEVEFKQAKTDLDNFGKAGASTGTNMKQLQERVTELSGTHATLTTNLKKEQAELEAVKAKNDALKTSVDGVNAAQKRVQDLFGKKLQPNVDLGTLNGANNKLVELKAKFEGAFTPGLLKEMFDPKQLDLLLQHVEQGKGEFEQFSRVVEGLGAALLTVEPGTKEFDDLSAAIRAGKSVIQEYTKLYADATNEVEKSDGAYKSIRTRLRELRDELTKLEEAGQDETDHYREVQMEAAKLTDQYGDMQQQIRILASDTKNLDFGLEALNAVGSGFQTVTGAMELFGVSTDTAEEAQKKLMSVMALVQGAQQLQNLLLKEGVIRTVGANIATTAYAATQRFLAASLGVTATASRALSAALITTGVGALVVGLGFLISKIVEWTSATEDAEAAQKSLDDELEHQSKLLSQDVENIEFNTKMRNDKLKQRGLSEQAIYLSNQQGLKEKIQAYQNEIDKLNESYAKTPLKQREAVLKQIYKLEDDQQKLIRDGMLAGADQEASIAEKSRQKQKQIRDKRLQDEKAALDLLAQIRRELALLGKTDEEKELINLKFNYDKQLAVLRKAHQDTTLADQLYEAQRLDIKEKYNKLRAESEKQILNELDNLNLEANEKRVANIDAQFTRQRAAIANEQAKAMAELQARQTALLDNLLSEKLKGNISPEKYAANVAEINSIFDKLFDDLEEKTARDYSALGGQILQSTIEGMNDALGVRIQSQVVEAADLYNRGKITYEEYQKAITKINHDENKARLENTIVTLKAEAALIEQRLKGNINSDERKSLGKQLTDINNQILDAQKALAEGDVTYKKGTEDSTNEHLQKVLGLYSSFTQTVVGFLNQINEAENARLDRSIALQQKRVDYARDIANKGNAEYLELEQKRLDALVEKREANARKQMAINNALTASQALVAAISAVAQASSQGGAIAAIAAGVAIVAAIGSLYNFVNSLEPPTAEFWEGTTFVEGEGGRDKIKAKVSRGEAIIPVDRNKEYHETVKAIYNRTIPAEALNYFVNSYPNFEMPVVDYSRVGIATDRHLQGKETVETNQKLDDLHRVFLRVADKLDNLDNVQMSFDENGFAISLIRAVQSEKMKWAY